MSVAPDPRSVPGVVALSGNPRAGSRTLLVATTVGRRIARALGQDGEVAELELADVAGELFATPAPTADAYRSTVASAAVLVVATPVYKASYTGLLKAFLDGYGPGGLAGVVAVPVVVSASPAHSFVAEHLLRPLLVELGATVPVAGLAVVESQLSDLDPVVDAWVDRAAPVLSRLV